MLAGVRFVLPTYHRAKRAPTTPTSIVCKPNASNIPAAKCDDDINEKAFWLFVLLSLRCCLSNSADQLIRKSFKLQQTCSIMCHYIHSRDYTTSSSKSENHSLISSYAINKALRRYRCIIAAIQTTSIHCSSFATRNNCRSDNKVPNDSRAGLDSHINGTTLSQIVRP